MPCQYWWQGNQQVWYWSYSNCPTGKSFHSVFFSSLKFMTFIWFRWVSIISWSIYWDWTNSTTRVTPAVLPPGIPHTVILCLDCVISFDVSAENWSGVRGTCEMVSLFSANWYGVRATVWPLCVLRWEVIGKQKQEGGALPRAHKTWAYTALHHCIQHL